MRRVLVVDDDIYTLEDLVDALEEEGYDVAVARNDRETYELLREGGALAAFVDYDLGPNSADGLEVLRRIRREHPEVEVVMITGVGDHTTALEAGRLGAFGFLRKPLDLAEVFVMLRNIEEMARLRRERDGLIRMLDEDHVMVRGRDPRMEWVYSLADRAAGSDVTVLITGETGVGKEVLARYIHRTSGRADGPFVVVHCPAVPESLAESELFGHRKGAFTGASEDRKGKVEQADGGTLFLDEVGDLSPAVQGKLLRFLETKEYTKLGWDGTLRADVRVMASTNRDLKAMVKEGKFRRDLFHRLGQLVIEVPPLRERRKDVPVLAEFFLERACKVHGRRRMRLSREALDLLSAYDFPGNVRELRNMIERAALTCVGDEVRPDDLVPQEAEELLPLRKAVDKFKREYIRKVLAMAGGNQARAARMLGVSRPHLNQLLRSMGDRKEGSKCP